MVSCHLWTLLVLALVQALLFKPSYATNRTAPNRDVPLNASITPAPPNRNGRTGASPGPNRNVTTGGRPNTSAIVAIQHKIYLTSKDVSDNMYPMATLVIIGLLVSANLFLNGMPLVATALGRTRMRSTVDKLNMSLFVANILVSAHLLFSYFQIRSMVTSNTFNMMIAAVLGSLITVSYLTAAVIAWHRFRGIYHPFAPAWTARRTIGIIILCWAIPSVFQLIFSVVMATMLHTLLINPSARHTYLVAGISVQCIIYFSVFLITSAFYSVCVWTLYHMPSSLLTAKDVSRSRLLANRRAAHRLFAGALTNLLLILPSIVLLISPLWRLPVDEFMTVTVKIRYGILFCIAVSTIISPLIYSRWVSFWRLFCPSPISQGRSTMGTEQTPLVPKRHATLTTSVHVSETTTYS